jgi:threonine dehydratase
MTSAGFACTHLSSVCHALTDTRSPWTAYRSPASTTRCITTSSIQAGLLAAPNLHTPAPLDTAIRHLADVTSRLALIVRAAPGLGASTSPSSRSEPVKVTAMKNLGAQIVVAGDNLTEAAAAALELAARQNPMHVEDGEDPGLMAGAATVLWEMLDAEPQLDAVVVPVGGGNLIAGSPLAAAMLRPATVVIGVQSAAARGATLSWLEGQMLTAECRTFAGGLATEHPGSLALGVIHALLERMILVTEEDIWKAIATGYEITGSPVEPAAAAGLAVLERFGEDIPGDRIGIMITGGRISATDLCRALSRQSG